MNTPRLDMPELQKTTELLATARVRAKDPNILDNIETDLSREAPAAQTTGPNRFTVLVPEGSTVLSLGAPGDLPRTEEPGIRAETNQHVHLRARAVNTLVRLGAQGSHAIDTLEEAGYLVHTDGSAKQESVGSHTILSTGSNLLLHSVATPPPPPTTAPTSAPASAPHAAAGHGAASYASLQSNHGFVEVVAGNATTVAAKKSVAITADSTLEAESFVHGESYKGNTTTTTGIKIAKGLLNSADLVFSAMSAFNGFSRVMAEARAAKSDFSKVPIQSAAKNLIDLAKLQSSALRLADDFSGGHASGASKVAIGSDGYVSIAGEIASSMYGHLSASVSSALSASVLGGTASVKGLTFAGLWAVVEASVKGFKDARLEAERGKAAVRGDQGAELSSERGGVTIRALGHVRLNSIGGNVLAHGHEVYCGSDRPEGHGMLATGGYVAVGRSKKLDDRGSFEIEKPCFMVQENSATMEAGSSKLWMNGNTIRAYRGEALAFSIHDDGHITLDGDKIHLG
jgi:hypothetical protein